MYKIGDIVGYSNVILLEFEQREKHRYVDGLFEKTHKIKNKNRYFEIINIFEGFALVKGINEEAFAIKINGLKMLTEFEIKKMKLKQTF
jgi:hypothetical protein